MASETPSKAPESVLTSLSSAVSRLRQPIRPADQYSYPDYYLSNTGAQVYGMIRRLPELISDPRAVAELNARIKPQAELARTVLQGIESPKAEVRKEMGVLAGKITRLIPAQEQQVLRRKEQQALDAKNADAFGEGMVKVLEEILNGTDEQGRPTQMVVLARAARIALSRVPKSQMDMLFTRGRDGRIHFGEEEMDVVTGLKARKAVATAINVATGGLLKDGEPPVSVKRGVKAVSGRIADGILKSYASVSGVDQAGQKNATRASVWLRQHEDAFDPKITKGIKRGKGLNAVIGRIDDVLQFVQYEVPYKLPAAIEAIPTDEQLVKIGDLIKAGIAVGLDGLTPLVDLKALQRRTL